MVGLASKESRTKEVSVPEALMTPEARLPVSAAAWPANPSGRRRCRQTITLNPRFFMIFLFSGWGVLLSCTSILTRIIIELNEWIR
ncbi:hypothetical protein [Mycolicibacterium sp.]|uniref:hypothetical protein n=1 Tax=Mycolicibacterium sp. TaxID=2320850 RepID=UPI0025FD5FD2|nr:hypothetical protein [Mycolicibacterium sp.]MCB9408784.1 hypothetical protein [Mycolicibacterium sp.]